MTETRLETLISYFNGSREMLKMVMEKDPSTLGKNSELAMGIFEDTLSILNHVKGIGEELTKIPQVENGTENILDQLKNSIKVEE